MSPRGRKPGTITDPENHVTEKQFTSRFKRGSYYAKKAGLPNEYQYCCRNCAITFNREQAKTHYFTTCEFNAEDASQATLGAIALTQDEIDTHRKVSQAYATADGRAKRKPIRPAIARKTDTAENAKTPRQEPFKTARQIRETQTKVVNPVLDKDQAFSLDIAEIAAYLEWITADRNQARRELESTREQLSQLRSAELSTDFWNTYNEYKRRS